MIVKEKQILNYFKLANNFSEKFGMRHFATCFKIFTRHTTEIPSNKVLSGNNDNRWNVEL